MLLLAADTSGKNGSIALARCSARDLCEILEVVALAGGTFSAQLVPQIASLLSHHNLNRNDLDGFAVISGPGSFTGLRIGLSAVKGLGEILARPIAAVSLLEVIAVEAGVGGKGIAALDAGRSEVYAGEYDKQQMFAQKLLTMAEFLDYSQGLPIVTPDTSIATAAGNRAREIPRPRADAVARLGWQKIQDGEIISPEALEANYIRRSDAEIFSAPR